MLVWLWALVWQWVWFGIVIGLVDGRWFGNGRWFGYGCWFGNVHGLVMDVGLYICMLVWLRALVW